MPVDNVAVLLSSSSSSSLRLSLILLLLSLLLEQQCLVAFFFCAVFIRNWHAIVSPCFVICACTCGYFFRIACSCMRFKWRINWIYVRFFSLSFIQTWSYSFLSNCMSRDYERTSWQDNENQRKIQVETTTETKIEKRFT